MRTELHRFQFFLVRKGTSRFWRPYVRLTVPIFMEPYKSILREAVNMLLGRVLGEQKKPYVGLKSSSKIWFRNKFQKQAVSYVHFHAF
jgi:hypothetical protein